MMWATQHANDCKGDSASSFPVFEPLGVPGKPMNLNELPQYVAFRECSTNFLGAFVNDIGPRLSSDYDDQSTKSPWYPDGIGTSWSNGSWDHPFTCAGPPRYERCLRTTSCSPSKVVDVLSTEGDSSFEDMPPMPRFYVEKETREAGAHQSAERVPQKPQGRLPRTATIATSNTSTTTTVGTSLQPRTVGREQQREQEQEQNQEDFLCMLCDEDSSSDGQGPSSIPAAVGPVIYEAERAKAGPPCVPSLGSRGHPHHCGAPCKFYPRAAGCYAGEQCPRCHLCWWTRAAHKKKAGYSVSVGTAPVMLNLSKSLIF